jgi:hypothetical protein
MYYNCCVVKKTYMKKFKSAMKKRSTVVVLAITIILTVV